MHEKSVLLAVMPITLLAFEEPLIAAWLPLWATLGMYPLLKKDGLSIAYWACLLLWLGISPPPSAAGNIAGASKQSMHSKSRRQKVRMPSWLKLLKPGWDGHDWLHRASLLLLAPAAFTHIAQWLLLPPARYLHLYDAAFVTCSFVYVAAVSVHLNIMQWFLPSTALDSQYKQA